jgi:hypothetical protein
LALDEFENTFVVLILVKGVEIEGAGLKGKSISMAEFLNGEHVHTCSFDG